ncbi:hypothetical protein HYDPIDRAFT_29643 [Hydnomerulius pinastri MD-312]|uniref:Uncharacterized protein n=1 Tax=Hydnomerulius pinastri MD-312 TaxID=994086 RepID=A0A0C9WEJ6_9AGAM|nr:hypothetical protein HYDPIDRAFT_29643 [Hydnomerulius pinastri MD-312]
METFSTDTLLSFKHLTGLRGSSSHNIFSASQPSLDLALHSPPWHTAGDLNESRFIALYSEADCPRVKFARNHASRGGAPKLLHSDPSKVYPSPPSSSSSSKATIPLPEEMGEFASFYSTHLLGVLDSPPVMRREDLASQTPLTPPPTLPQSTLDLPDDDDDVTFEDEAVEEEEIQYEDDEPFYSPSGSSSPSADSELPLSPLSPTWDSHCPQAPSVALIPECPSDPEQLHSIWSPYSASKALPLDISFGPSDDISPLASQEPSSLLEVDSPRPFLPPINIPWSPPQTYDAEHEPPQPTTSYAPLSSLTDYNELPPPCSPLISRLTLPELDDDEMPHIVPSSPCRRSCSCLPDSDVEMSDSTSDTAPASPSQQLLSLPGADIDDDLIPAIDSAPPPTFFPYTPRQPLLFIDDPRDVPLPRSPSPEDFDLCLSPEGITDPELAKLFDLRKRSVAAERAARRVEALTAEIDLFTRAEARKTRKRERERSKEVGALLRLKLGDGVGACPQEESPESDHQHQHHRRRGVIGNISQLVAQMVFRRNETSRPLAKRKTAMAPRDYVRSSLSRAIVTDM